MEEKEEITIQLPKRIIDYLRSCEERFKVKSKKYIEDLVTTMIDEEIHCHER